VFVCRFAGRSNDIHNLLTESLLNIGVFGDHIHGEGEEGHDSITSCNKKVDELRFCQKLVTVRASILTSSLRIVRSVMT